MPRCVVNLIVMLALVGGLGLFASVAQRAQAAPDLEALLRLYYQAIDRGDAAAAAAFFTDDGVLTTGGPCPAAAPCTGKAEIQRGLTATIGIKVSYGILSSSVSGNTVQAQIESWNTNIASVGLQRVMYKVTATFSGDKISRYVHAPDLSDAQSAQYSGFQLLISLGDSMLNFLQRGDSSAMLALYADDAVFQGLGLCADAPCRGKEPIRREVEREVADHTTFATTGAGSQLLGKGISTQRYFQSDSIRAGGVDRILIAIRLEGTGGKLTSLRWTPIAEDAQTAAFLAAQGGAAAPAQLPHAGGDTLPLASAIAIGGLFLAAGLAMRRLALLTA